MIDQVYQDEINKSLDDQQRRPGPRTAESVPTFKNFAAGFGGLVAGPLQAAAAKSDLIFGDAQILTGAGTDSAGGMFAVQSPKEQAEAQAMREKLALSGPDFNSPTGAGLRQKASEFMPDPQSTGKAGQILGGLTNFASQAVPSALGGPAGLLSLGADRGMQKSDELQAQGIDTVTRLAAGTAAGALDAGSMVLPMTGATRWIAAGKGAVGGAGTAIAQSAAEKYILQARGYGQLASTYDPFDPVSIALGALVPAGFGAAFHGAHPGGKAGDVHEPNKADGAFTPPEAAHAAAVEHIDSNIAELQGEISKQKDAAAKAVLQAELDKLTAQKQAGAHDVAQAVDPNVDAAARVTQAADAIDHSRLTPADDLAGREQHTQAVETASDQIGRGEPVEVGGIVNTPNESTPIALQPVQPVFRDRRIDVQATEAALPPVADSDIRLYRAESPTTGFSDVFNPDGLTGHRRADVPGVRYTTELSVADYYRDAYNGNRDATIHYIDVPKEVAERGRIADLEFKVDVPAENASRLRSARVGELTRGADEYRAALAPEAAQIKPNHAAFHEAKNATKEQGDVQDNAGGGGADGRSENAGSRAAVLEPGDGEGRSAGPAVEPSRLQSAVDEILKADPDLMVMLDGMEAPMRVSELLDAVREQGQERIRDSKLLDVAAQCFLSH